MYEFDRFTVDPAHRRLLVTATASAVELPPRAFDLLLLMAERPGELLTKRELMKILWPNVVVEENSLNQVISLLRRVLGEKPSEHRFIVTAPGRGYRFVAAVRRVVPAGEAQSSDALSIAVLPFADRSMPAGREYLGDAIAADLIRGLSPRAPLRVTAQSSSFEFRDRLQPAGEIARRLNVRRLLEGELSLQQDNLSVTARLLDGDSGRLLWSSTLQRNIAAIAGLQADLVRQVSLAMDSTLPAPSPGATVDSEAYLAYLRALSLSQRPSPEGTKSTIDLLRSALERDPGFARARSLLAIQYTTCVMFGFPVEDALDLARQHTAAALELDDLNGETHCAAAVIDCLSGAWSRAEERFRIAQSLTADPLVSGLRCAYLTFSVGQLQRALLQAEHTLHVAPTHPIGMQMLATLHEARGQDASARRYAELAVDLGQSPAIAPLADVFSQLALRAGRSDEARRYLSATLPARLQEAEGPEVMALLCRAYADPAQGSVAARSVRWLEAALTAGELDPPMRKRLILWYALCNELDTAFDLAQRSLEHYAREGTVGGAWGVLWLPEMRAFRSDGRFQPFARRLRLFEYWSEFGPPDGYALASDRLVPEDR